MFNHLLTVAQYKEAIQPFDGGAFEKMIFLVSVVNDLDILDVQDWRADKLIQHYKIALDAVQIKSRHKESIEIDEQIHSLIPFKKLSLGMFIDIENSIDDIGKICAILYTKGEKYSKVNIEERAGKMEQVPIDFVFGAYKLYLNFRESFFKSYDVFSDPFEGVDVDELDEEERVIYNEEIKQREKQGDQWMTVVNALSTNDVTKFEKVLKLNLFLCFNQLSFLKSHNS